MQVNSFCSPVYNACFSAQKEICSQLNEKKFERAMIQINVEEILSLIDSGFNAFEYPLENIVQSRVFIENLVEHSWENISKALWDKAFRGENTLEVLEAAFRSIEDVEFDELHSEFKNLILSLKSKKDNDEEITEADLKNFLKEYFVYSCIEDGESAFSLLEIAVVFLKNEALIQKWIDLYQREGSSNDSSVCCSSVTSLLLANKEGLDVIQSLMNKGYELSAIILNPINFKSIQADALVTQELYHFLTDYPSKELLSFTLDSKICDRYNFKEFLRECLYEGSENFYCLLVEALYEQQSLDSLLTLKLLLEKTPELASLSLQNLKLELSDDNVELRQEIIDIIESFR